MKKNYPVPLLVGKLFFLFLLSLAGTPFASAQERVFASEISSHAHADSLFFATDLKLNTASSITSHSGTVLGNDSYEGHLELRFPHVLSSGTTSYLKIETEDPLLELLLGGSLEDLLSEVSGTLLLGHQEFRVDAKLDDQVVLSGTSSVYGDFERDQLRIVSDSKGAYYVAITPDSSYNSIRITNILGSLLGLNSSRELQVYAAFYFPSPLQCAETHYTSYNGDGLTVDLLNIGGAGVQNPHHFIDGDPNTYSELSLGIVNALASIEQTAYIAGGSETTDEFLLTFRLDPSLLALGVLSNIEIVGIRDHVPVFSTLLLDLVNIEVLGLLQNYEAATLRIQPGLSLDRLTIRYKALLNTSLSQRIDLFDLQRVPATPSVSATELAVCRGESATLSAAADPADLELRWYASSSGGSVLGTTNSGEDFHSEPVYSDVTLYVAAARPGCPQESARIAVEIQVQDTPVSSDLAVIGNEYPACVGEDVIITAFSQRAGTFKWYLDSQKTVEILHESTHDGLFFSLTNETQIAVSGLQNNTAIYLSLIDSTTGCELPAGELLEVPLTIQPPLSGLEVTLDPNITEDDIINAQEATEMITISGFAEGGAQAGDSYYLAVNGQEFHGTLQSDLRFSQRVPGEALVQDTDHILEVVLTHSSENCDSTVRDSESYLVDTDAPVKPTVNALTTSNPTPLISGTCEIGATLQVTVNGNTYTEGDGHLVNPGNGTWELQIPAGNELPEGTYDVQAISTDTAGNIAEDETADELEIDHTPPASPTVNPLATADATPVIYGTATSAATISVTVDGISYMEGDGQLADLGNDTWKLEIPVTNPLADGVYDVSAVLTDEAGNTSMDATTDELEIDSSLPETPVINFLSTSDTTPLITGTAQSSDFLSITLNGETYMEGDGHLTDHGDGTWSLQVPSNRSLPDDTYDLVATATQGAKTSEDASLNELLVDTTPPAAPTVNTLLTNDQTPTITGTATSEDILQVEVNGIVYAEGDGHLTDHGDGTWSLQIPSGNELPEGVYEIQVTVSDQVGNTSVDASTNELEIDISPLAVPVVDPSLSDTGEAVISGQAASEGFLEVTINGITYIEGEGDLTDHGDDTWVLVIPSGESLADGIYDVSASLTDAAGNESFDLTLDELEVDTTAPLAPTVNTTQNTDGLPLLSGSASSEDLLTVSVNGVVYTEGDGNLVDHGDGTWSLQVPESDILEDGTYDIMARLVDTAGNESTDVTTNELVVDGTPPATPTVDTLISSSTNPAITGTAPSEDQLQVTFNGQTYEEGDGYLVDHGDGTWTLTLPDGTQLEEGVYEVVAIVTDQVGNSSTDTTNDEVIIDLTDPVVPEVDFLETEDNTPLLTGTATSDDFLTVIVNGVTYTEGDGYLVDHGDDSWSLEIPESEVLPAGSYDILARSVDLAGNESVDATTNELQILQPEIEKIDLSVSMEVDRNIVMIGETVTYTITVFNSGEVSLQDLEFAIALGDAMEITDYSGDGTYSPFNGIWTIAELKPGERLTLVITAFGNSSGLQSGTTELTRTAHGEVDRTLEQADVELMVSCLQVFNEFTPNRDGKNDTFRISCIEQYPDAEIRVFNRYGNLVFQTRNYANDWDGVANVPGVFNAGEPLPSATYFYILKLDEESPERRGWLFIKR